MDGQNAEVEPSLVFKLIDSLVINIFFRKEEILLVTPITVYKLNIHRR